MIPPNQGSENCIISVKTFFSKPHTDRNKKEQKTPCREYIASPLGMTTLADTLTKVGTFLCTNSQLALHHTSMIQVPQHQYDTGVPQHQYDIGVPQHQYDIGVPQH